MQCFFDVYQVILPEVRLVGAMAGRNIPSTNRKNRYYCMCYADILETYQRQIKRFEFSRDAFREEFNIRKNNVTSQ